MNKFLQELGEKYKPISKQKIADLIALIQNTYPGWTNFQILVIIKDEIDYKRDAIDKANAIK